MGKTGITHVLMELLTWGSCGLLTQVQESVERGGFQHTPNTAASEKQGVAETYLHPEMCKEVTKHKTDVPEQRERAENH